MKCAKGICFVCETPIARPCTDCGTSYTLLDNYTTVNLKWSNGSQMTFPVCIPCSQGPVWKVDKVAATKAVWDEWDRLGASYDKEVVIV